jgi:hypothetical protein
MKKYTFFIVFVFFVFSSLCINVGRVFADKPKKSLVGTWIGRVEDLYSRKQGQLTIVITSDTETVVGGRHEITGTVKLTGIPLCFTQGLFSSETGIGWWSEMGYTGTILALGDGFSKAYLTFRISSDVMELHLLGGGGTGFYNSNDEICFILSRDAIITKKPNQNSDFSANPTAGLVPLTVNFTDKSTGSITSWEWDFGDGSTSIKKNPSHTYNNPGTYTVTLIVTGPGGSDAEKKNNFIKVMPTVKSMPWLPLLLFDK